MNSKEISIIVADLLTQYQDPNQLEKARDSFIQKFGKTTYQQIEDEFGNQWFKRTFYNESELKKESAKPIREKAAIKSNVVRQNSSSAIKASVSIEEIANSLISKYKTFNEIVKNRDSIIRKIGYTDYKSVITHLQDKKKASDNTGQGSPMYLLPVIRKEKREGVLFFVVSFTPDKSSQPKEYYVPISNKLLITKHRIGCSLHGDVLKLNEKWVLKSIFPKGKEFAFSVIAVEKGKKKNTYILEDRYGERHHLITSKEFLQGETIICTVSGYSKRAALDNALVLDGDSARIKGMSSDAVFRVIKHGESDERAALEDEEMVYGDNTAPWIPSDRKGPEYWQTIVEGYDKHKCRKSFICDCCGRSFNANQGYRVELKDLYFCNQCKLLIYPKSGRGYVRIISTPMGNKR